jgi:hypothetical protein
VAVKMGALVGAVLNASSSWNWAHQGYGRRAVFLFEGGLLVLETNLGGAPLGDEVVRRYGDVDFTHLADQVEELGALDPRNLLIPLGEVASARLSSRRIAPDFARVLRLDLTVSNGGQHSFFWSPRRTYHRMEPDGALPRPRPRRAYEAAVADFERIFGSRVSGSPK